MVIYRFVNTLCYLFLLLSLISCATVKAQTVTVEVNWKKIPNYEYRIIDGKISGPITPIVKALGGSFNYSKYANILYINERSPWIELDIAQIGWGRTDPYYLSGLVPVIYLRQYLNGIQDSSLSKLGHGSSEILARYEVIGSYNNDMDSAPELSTSLSNYDRQGFLVRAYLYWAHIADDNFTTKAVSHKGSISFEGPKIDSVRIELVNYLLKPIDVSPIIKNNGEEHIDLGLIGWTVDSQNVISTKDIALTSSNDVLPIYDISIQALQTVDPIK